MHPPPRLLRNSREQNTGEPEDQLTFRPVSSDGESLRIETREEAMISAKLVAALLTAISGYTGYAIPGDPPQITTLSHDALAQKVCGQPCQIYGFTAPDGEVFMDEKLKIGTDPVATSILVHELTHFLQIKSIAHPQPVDCRIWNDREREAFAVQARWLRDTASSIQVFSVEMARLNFAGMRETCVGDASPATDTSAP